MKKQTKKNIVNYGLKIGVIIKVVESIGSIRKDTTLVNKVILATVTSLVGGAQYIIVDEIIKNLFSEYE